MRVLVTAGSTQVPIDKVRAITNIFNGQTGTKIAHHFAGQGAEVTLLTSSPHLARASDRLNVMPYKTYDRLGDLMQEELAGQTPYDVLIHSSAVSDYRVEGTYVQGRSGLEKIESSGKIASSHKELFLKLVPTLKLIDLVRDAWNFKGVLVKFKLQVGVSDDELLRIARKSMHESDADLMVANCLDWKESRAYVLGRGHTETKEVQRDDLSDTLYQEVRRLT